MTGSAKRPRLILVDDHRLFLAGMAKLLHESCEIVAEIDDSSELLEAMRTVQSDIVLLGVSVPGLESIELARGIRKSAPASKIIFVGVHEEPSIVGAALSAGASGYVLKNSTPEDLIHAIEEVFRDRFYISPALVHSSNSARPPGSPLTPRQKEVLRLVANGLGTREIAERLFITPKAVEFHRGRIRAALGLRTTAELVRYAITHGLADL